MKENNVILSIVQAVRGLKQRYDSWGILNWCNKNPIILCAFDHWPFGKNNKMCHGGLSVKNITHRKFLEVTAVQGIVKMLGDVFPGGQPVVSLLLPGVVMVPPWWGGKRPPNLKYVKSEYKYSRWREKYSFLLLSRRTEGFPRLLGRRRSVETGLATAEPSCHEKLETSKHVSDPAHSLIFRSQIEN